MKYCKTLFLCLIAGVIVNDALAQSGSWKLSGNSLTGTEKLGSKNATDVKFYSNDINRMTLKSDGKLGIGINSPVELVHIYGGKLKIDADLPTGTPTLRINDPNVGNMLITFEEADVPKAWIGYDHSTADFVISAYEFGTRPDFCINDSAGYVGIGIADPKYKLQVEGPTFINESLYCEGDLVMSSVNPAIVSGDIVFTYDQQDIGFIAPSNASASPMLHMGGASSYSRMLAAKGLGADIDKGILFDYADNQFDFQNNASEKVLSVDLDGNFVGINTVSTIGAADFVMKSTNSSSYGGMYIDMEGTSRRPFYGYALGGLATMWHYYDESTDQWRINMSGDKFYFTGTGRLGLSVSSPSYQLQLSSNSAAKPTSSSWTVVSDARLKTDITAFTEGLSIIQQIEPVWFNYNGKAGMPVNERGVGTIAQELQKIAPYMVNEWEYVNDETGEKENYLGVDYGAMDFLLVNAIKEQQQQIETQGATIEKLEAQINALYTLLAQADKQIQAVNITSASLQQNFPNPFSNTTTIRYYLPESADGVLKIYNVAGELLHSFALLQKGNAGITLQTNDLSAGTYQYTLEVNGEIADTKQMIIAK
jgi:hypothetical protein